ncbi:MAG: pitrilysin family protein [Candidatus Woesearchaeota archaeon]
MIRKRLKNGLRAVYYKTDDKTVVIEVNVYVGSNNETNGNRGISHFIEHMLFEGTINRPNSKAIASAIENLGGEFNAATSNERTYYYVKILKKHFDTALDVLADIIQNPLFTPKMIEKEKKVIINEIDMVNDEPRFFQWILFEKGLYRKNNARFPVYGNKKDVASFTRERLLLYFNNYYVPNNIVVTVVGDIISPIKKIQEKFSFTSKKSPPILKYIKEKHTKENIIKIKKPVHQTYFVLGYDTMSTKSKESITLDIIRAILGCGFSGTLFEELRNKRGLVYEIGVVNETKINFGYFAVYLNTQKKNINKVKKIVLEEIDKIEDLTSDDLKKAKSYLEGEFAIAYDDNQHLADLLSFLELVKDASLMYEYQKYLRKITIKDVIKVKRKYLNNHTIAIIEQNK